MPPGVLEKEDRAPMPGWPWPIIYLPAHPSRMTSEGPGLSQRFRSGSAIDVVSFRFCRLWEEGGNWAACLMKGSTASWVSSCGTQ